MPTDTEKPGTQAQQNPRAGEIGRTGTVNTDGWIHGTETNPNLRWPKSLEVFENMRKTEITVRAMIAYITAALIASEWAPQACSEDELDQEVADFSLAAMRHLEGGWTGFMRRLTSYLPMGFYVGEKCWELRTVEYGDGKSREAFIITKVADRLQRTIYKWHDNNGRGPLTEIEQYLADALDDGTVRIPRDKCILIVNEQEGNDYFGNSILRSAYGAFVNKRRLESIEAIGIERSVGVIVAYTPDNATDPVLDEVEDQLQKLHQAENMYLIAPGKKQQSGALDGNGWLFETLDVKGDAGTAKAHEAIQRYTTEIAQNVLAEFMRLGHNETGARATAGTQKNPYVDAVKTVAKHIGDVLKDEYLAPIVRLNFGEGVDVPELDAVGLEKVDVAEFSAAFSQLVSASGLTITDKDESYLRSMLGLPEIDPEERERIQQEKIQQAQQAMLAKSKTGGDPQNDAKAKGDNLKPVKEDDPTQEDPTKAHAFREPMPVKRTYWRDLTPLEEFVAWDALDAGIDAQRAEFQMAGKGPVEAYIDAKLAGKSPSVDDLAGALEAELTQTAQFGWEQVGKELERQKAAVSFEVAGHLPDAALEEVKRRARLAAESVIGAVAIALKRSRLDQLRRNRPEVTQLREKAIEVGRVALRDEALENITATLNLGRNGRALKEGVTDAVLSSVLDSGTCGECNAADGTETTVGSPTFDELNPPLAACDGENRCRCIWVYRGREAV